MVSWDWKSFSTETARNFEDLDNRISEVVYVNSSRCKNGSNQYNGICNKVLIIDSPALARKNTQPIKHKLSSTL